MVKWLYLNLRDLWLKVILTSFLTYILASIQDTSVFKALDAGSKAVDQMNKQIDIDNLEDLKDKIDEQAQEMAEK